MPSAAVDWTQGDVQNHFEVNDLAMEINGPWNVPCLEKPSVCGGSVAPSAKAVGGLWPRSRLAYLAKS